MKYSTMQRALARILAGITLCGGMIACKKSVEAPEDTTGTRDTTTETVAEETILDETVADDTAAVTDAETQAKEDVTEGEAETEEPVDDTLAGKYGEAIQALNGNYANYRFAEVTKTPALDLSFDTVEDLAAIPNGGSGSGTAHVVNADGVSLITGRFEQRKALDLNGQGTYVAAPDLGEQEALTISMWVNLRDISSRESECP